MGKNARKAKNKNHREVSDLAVCVTIADELKKDVMENCKFPQDRCLQRAFMSAVSVQSVKSVINDLDTICFTSKAILLRTLLRCFLISADRSSLRNVTASILDRIDCFDDPASETLGMLSNMVRDFLQCIHHSLTTETGRHAENIIVYCMASNCKLGQRIMMPISSEILEFHYHYLDYMTSLSIASSQMLQCDTARGFKCIATLSKKKSEQVTEQSRFEDHVVQRLLQVCRKTFAMNSLEWNCYCAAGLAYVSLLRSTSDNYTLLEKLKETLLHLNDNLNEHEKHDTCSNIHQTLGVCNATLALLNHETLFRTYAIHNADNFLIQVILPAIKDVDQKCKLISDQLIIAKCYVQWSRQFMDACMNDEYRSACMKVTESHVLEDLLDIAITKLGHPTDAIRHQANEILVNVLKISDTIGHKFSKDLLEVALHQNWKKRSTFTTLNCILQQVSPATIFEKMPQITKRLLNACEQQPLAPYASDTYRILAERTYQSYIQAGLNNAIVQYEIFFNPLCDVMCLSSIHSLQLLVNYCFVKLAKVYGESGVVYFLTRLRHMMVDLHAKSETNGQMLASFLNCLKVSVTRRIITIENCVIYDESVQAMIKSSLLHQNDEIRHLAFSLLCESSRPSCLVATYSLDSIKHALPFNLSCQDPAFRQKLIVSMKKILLQIKGNLALLHKASDQQDRIETYHDFIRWMIDCMSSQLDLLSPYVKRITSITILVHLVDIFIDYGSSGFQPCHCIYTVNSVRSLFNLLSDPYPDVREYVYHLLSQEQAMDFIKKEMPQEWLDCMFSKGFSRARECSQPEYCVDSAYHMRLYAAVTSGTDCDRNTIILRLSKDILRQLQEDLSVARKNLYLAATSSPIYGLLFCLKCLLQDVQFGNIDGMTREIWRKLIADTMSICFEISEAVLPVVGSVSPEGHLPEVEQHVTDEIDGGPDDAWNKLPEVIKSLIIGDSIDDHEEHNTRAISQLILVCCWRSAKESSLFLQELTTGTFPLDSSADIHDGVVSWKQLIRVGEHLTTQLRTARHRGAFEITYYVFKAYCPRLWNNSHGELNSIPQKWLQETLSDLENPKRLQDLCATRRSAGLPFFMQALLSCNKSAKSRSMLQNVMSTLVALSKRSGEKALISKVHSLNILRGLVKDASLGEEILPYLSQCVMVAITGFESTVWAIRNSSTLLFSALFTRIFGVKQDKNDVTSSKNRLSANEFFSRLPGLHSFLYNCLNTVTSDVELGGHHALAPILHPILLLLSRVYPSTMPSATNTSLSEFISLLMKCRATAVYKSRVAAAVALASIVTWDACWDTFTNCCQNLVIDVSILCGVRKQNEMSKSSPHNRIHGGLLQVKQLLFKFADDDPSSMLSTKNSARDVVRSVQQTLTNVLAILTSKHNQCMITKSVAIELFLVIQSFALDDASIQDSADAHRILAVSMDLYTSDGNCFCQPGDTFLLEVAATCVVSTSPSFKDVASTMEVVISNKDSDKFANLLSAFLENWNVMETRFSQDLPALESIIRNATLNAVWNKEVETLMYKILSKCASEESTKWLLLKSLTSASICNASQSQLLVALIEFQTVCISIILDQPVAQDNVVTINRWAKVISQSSKSFENTDDVRLAVANSLSANFSVYISKNEDLSSSIVLLWEVLIHLFCDEEPDVRFVASNVVNKINLMMTASTGIAGSHPRIDSLSLHHAFRLMILTQGEIRRDECRRILKAFAASQPAAVVPATFQECDQTKIPQLFERSQLNTYYDSQRISAAAEEALDFLGS